MNKLEQAARQVVDAWDLGEFSTRMDEAITALREALAEPKLYNHETGSVLIPNPLTEQAEQEPVAWGYFDADGSFMDALGKQHGAYQTPLYAAPVRTKDLTDDEILEAVGTSVMDTLRKHGFVPPTERPD